jgi:hypothetical protein
MGPRFYDWQLAQSPEESWRECHLHARNLLGREGYFKLLAEVLSETEQDRWKDVLSLACDLEAKEHLQAIFSNALGHVPTEPWEMRLDEVKRLFSERGFQLDLRDTIEILFMALKEIKERDRREAMSTIRELVGEAAFNQFLAALEAGNQPHVAEQAARYGDNFPGKMTQMRLFD